MEFQIVLLRQKHSRRHRAQAKRAVREQNGRRVQAGQAVGEVRLRPARRIERGHQRKHANGEQNGRSERAEKPQPRPQAHDEIRGDDGPRDEDRGFVEIVDRALVQREAALKHRGGVQSERGQQQQIIHPVVLPKPFAPQEDRVNHADAVKHHGEQEKMSVSKPGHGDRLIQE